MKFPYVKRTNTKVYDLTDFCTVPQRFIFIIVSFFAKKIYALKVSVCLRGGRRAYETFPKIPPLVKREKP